MPDLTDHIPPGATILTPAEGQPIEIAYGYITETGADVIAVTVRDARHGPHTLALTPPLAATLANTIRQRCDNLARLQADQQNGDNDDGN